MATIQKRETKNGYNYKIQVKYRDKGSGKIITHSTTFEPPEGLSAKLAERQALVFADEYEKKIRNVAASTKSVAGISPETTFKEYASKWLEHVKNDLSLSYYVNASKALKVASQNIGGYKLKELNPVIIQNFYDTLDRRIKVTHIIHVNGDFRKIIKSKGIRYTDLVNKYHVVKGCINATQNGETVNMRTAERIAKILGMDVRTLFNVKTTRGPYSYETNHRIKRTVRVVLAQAKRQRLIDDNWASADFITFPKKPAHEIEFLDDTKAHIFYDKVDTLADIRIKTAMKTLLLTGLRRGELCGLEWDDIDLDNKTLTVRRSAVTVDGFGVVTKDPKTETSKRTLSIPDTLVNQLTEYKGWYEDMRQKLGDAWIESNRLFTQWNGTAINPNTIRVWLRKAMQETDLNNVSVHSLRHTNITLQIAAGVPLVTVSGRAGHARTSTTTDVYSHFLKSSDRAAADALDGIFGKK